MATDPDFLDHVKDLFADLGNIRTGRMFGGTSLYLDDAMFAVIFGDAVYMKSDDTLRAAYDDAGSQPFVYETKSGPRTIPGMMQLPDAALDDPEDAVQWARKSLIPAQQAALKRNAAKARRKK